MCRKLLMKVAHWSFKVLMSELAGHPARIDDAQMQPPASLNTNPTAAESDSYTHSTSHAKPRVQYLRLTRVCGGRAALTRRPFLHRRKTRQDVPAIPSREHTPRKCIMRTVHFVAAYYCTASMGCTVFQGGRVQDTMHSP